jgi:hypothetical protein
MDYEALFCKYDLPEVKECNCYSEIRVTLLIVTLLALLVDCVGHCRARSRVKTLTAENETMKSLILTSLDKAFTGIMKNGYESENEHED